MSRKEIITRYSRRVVKYRVDFEPRKVDGGYKGKLYKDVQHKL